MIFLFKIMKKIYGIVIVAFFTIAVV